jgi:hypothetical protein
MSALVPHDHAEAIALFRSEIIGALTRRELDRGELAQALAELSQQRFRPPQAKSTKTSRRSSAGTTLTSPVDSWRCDQLHARIEVAAAT